MPILPEKPRKKDIANVVNGALPIVGGPGINVVTGGGGTTIRMESRSPGESWWLGKIVDTGPAGEAEPTDNTYYVKRIRISNATASPATAAAEAVTTAVMTTGGPFYLHVLVSNLAEDVDGTHNLPVDTLLQVFQERDAAGMVKYYTITGGGDGGTWIKITGHTSIGDNRWSYSWTEQKCVLNGQWTDKPGGKTSVSEDILAFNTVESNNGPTGIMGNSIDLAWLSEGFTILPVQGSPVVRAFKVTNCDGDPEYVFSYENAVGGPPCGG